MTAVGHRLPLISAFFLCGVSVAQFFPSLPHPLWTLCAPVFAWALWRWRILWPLGVLLCGLLWALLRGAWILSAALPASLIGQDVWVTGRVDSLPVSTPYAQQFVFVAESLLADEHYYSPPGRIRLRWYKEGEPVAIQPGQRWRLKVRLKPPRGFQNPGGFDYEAWLFRQRIRATGYVRPDAGNRRLSTGSTLSIDRWRQGIRDAITGNPATKETGLLAALAVGARDNVQHSQWQVLRRTGTAHLLAISGLHVGLAAGLGMLLGAGIWRVNVHLLQWRPAQQAGAVTGLITALAYAALAGFSIPTQRAVVMLAVLMLGLLLRRPVWPIQTLGSALLAVLIWDPLAVIDAGFWLSFAAVAAIFWTLARREHGVANLWQRRWQGWWRVQWLLWLTLAPLLLAFFGQVALTAPVANLVAVPVVAFLVVPLVLAGVLAHAVDLLAVATWSWQWAGEVLAHLWPFLDALARPDFAVWRGASPSGWTLAAAVMGVLLLALPRGLPGRWLGLLLCLPALFPVSPPQSPGTFRVTVLDVGQGLSVVVQTRGHTLVYDTGARYRSGFDLGAAVVVPYLQRNGYRHGMSGPVIVDALVISHGDNDHIGGMPSVVAATQVRRVLSSVPERVPAASACVKGQAWTWDGVRFEILHPARPGVPAHNNASCVLKISGPYGSMLLTGDIEAAAERALLADPDRLASDVMLVPHQGSRTSSSVDFLAAVAPQSAVVAAGYYNRYGHPHPKVVSRYQRAGIPLYNTALSGAIHVNFDERGISLDEQRQRARRYWFSP